jgi:NitT/TauT family transport system permease protein
LPLIVFHTSRVREALRAPARIGLDLIVLLVVGGAIGAIATFGKQVTAPFLDKVEISLSFWALPKYTMFSLARGVAAYLLSLGFTLVYGTVAAHNHRAEKIMVPALDVLQAIPVLGFLPGLVIAMISLFPTREIGLELACIVMIFTAQVWNMTFSFHGSLRGIPAPLREVAAIQRLNGWQIFRLLELPAAMIGLVWNSMMSMAGGWFFLTVNEAFTLGDKDYRLPGIGSYMNEAINQGNTPAMIAAIIAMIIMIVVVDQLIWRPIVVWSQRFKMEDSADADKPQSWVLAVLAHSRLWQWVIRKLHRSHAAHEPIAALPLNPQGVGAPAPKPKPPTVPSTMWPTLLMFARWSFFVLLAIGSAWGVWKLVRLLLELPIHAESHEDWVHVLLSLGASFIRTTAAVAIGAAWTLPVGIMIGLSPRWSQRLQPIIQVVASFPAPMLFPLVTMLLVILHVPFTMGCVALMLLGAQWYILFNVIAGASSIPADLKEVGHVYHMTKRQRWTNIYLPCVFPDLVTGLVTAAGGAWNATIVSEYVQTKGQTFTAFGLGSTISVATAKANYPLLAAGIVTMALFVVLVNRLFWKRLYRLAEDRYSLNV